MRESVSHWLWHVKAAAAVACCAGVAVLGCKAPPPPATPSRAGVQPEVQQALIDAHTALISAYESGDVEAFCALLDRSPDLLIFHPMSEDRFDSIDEIRKRMPAMFAALGEVVWTDAHPIVIQRGDIAWVTSQVLIDGSGLERPFIGRGTEIWVHDGGTWRLIHAHWSREPSSVKQAGTLQEGGGE